MAEKKREPFVTVAVRIPPKYLSTLKINALAKGLSLSDFLRRLIMDWVDEKRSGK